MGFQQSYECGSRYPQDNTLRTNELFYLPSQWGAQSPHHCDTPASYKITGLYPYNGVRDQHDKTA